jgi:hypothetical protein
MTERRTRSHTPSLIAEGLDAVLSHRPAVFDVHELVQERINEGGIVGKVGLGYDYDIVVHELRPKSSFRLGLQ